MSAGQAPPGRRVQLPLQLASAVAESFTRAQSERVVTRIWERDATVWAEAGTPEVADRLGWLAGPETMRTALGDLTAFRESCVADGLTDAVVLGMGGSSLAPEVFRSSFERGSDGLALHVLDSTHPDAVHAVEDAVDLEQTLFLVSTKSGGTIETLSLFSHFYARVKDRRGDQAGRAFAAITDPGSSLIRLAEEHGFRETFLNDPDIGGRYSALSYFGLVPAALLGVDLEPLLERAWLAAQACRDEGEANDGLWLGVALAELARAGADKLTLVLPEPIEALGLWIEQLIAESTGKEGRGILPIAGEPLGEAESYGGDRVFVAHPGGGGEPALEAIARAGRPLIELPIDGVEDLGRLFFVWEFATAVAGRVLGINPFDQPNVQEAKDATSGVLDAYDERGRLPDVATATGERVEALAVQLEPPHYLALMGYMPPSAGVDLAIGRLRAAVRDARGVATTFGYGPRFLHSIGQLHKGGPASGVFVQLLQAPRRDAEVPGAGWSFATLIEAQATGDLETLRAHSLPAERLVVDGDDVAGAIDALATKLAAPGGGG